MMTLLSALEIGAELRNWLIARLPDAFRNRCGTGKDSGETSIHCLVILDGQHPVVEVLWRRRHPQLHEAIYAVDAAVSG